MNESKDSFIMPNHFRCYRLEGFDWFHILNEV